MTFAPAVCPSDEKRKKRCSIVQPCDPKEPSYRMLQCKYHDYSKFLQVKGNHTWTVVDDPTFDPCALYCINEVMEFLQVEPVVNDSTPCKPGTNNMCISGICRVISHLSSFLHFVIWNLYLYLYFVILASTIHHWILIFKSFHFMVLTNAWRYRLLVAIGCWTRTPSRTSVEFAKAMVQNAGK